MKLKFLKKSLKLFANYYLVIVDPCPNDAKIALNNRWLLTSPNYPQDYGKNHDCEWTFSVPTGSKIAIKFHSFKVCTLSWNLVPIIKDIFFNQLWLDSIKFIRIMWRLFDDWWWIKKGKILWNIWRHRCTKYDCVKW